MSSTSYVSTSTNPLKRSHSSAFRPTKFCPSAQQTVIGAVFRPRKKARLTAPAPSPVPQFLNNDSAHEPRGTQDSKKQANSVPSDESTIMPARYRHDVPASSIIARSRPDLKLAIIVQLIFTIRENRKTNEANNLILTSERNKAHFELHVNVTAHKRMVRQEDQLHTRFRKVWDNKKKDDYFRGALLLATRDKLRKDKADMMLLIRQSKKSLRKLEAKLAESRKLLEDEVAKEQELVKAMGKTTSSGA